MVIIHYYFAMNSILLCVVLYNENLLQSKTYLSFLRQNHACNLFVYDNSPESQMINRPNAIYVHDPDNSGLSVAYNTAAKYAKENGFEWMLLLDQDTDFTNITIDDYIINIENEPDIKLFAPRVKCGCHYMSPIIFRHKMGFLQDKSLSGVILLKDYSIINSGMCVNVEALFKCGGYKDEVFLDYSDHQFVERLKKMFPTAYIIDKDILQSFSAISDDKETSIKRYKLFCKSIKACDRNSFSDSFWYFVLVIKRGISLVFKNFTLKPLKIFFSEYL